MPPKRRRSVSTLMTRAPPAAYWRGQLGGVGDVGQVALGRAAPLDLGDDPDAGCAQRGEGVEGRAGVQRGGLAPRPAACAASRAARSSRTPATMSSSTLTSRGSPARSPLPVARRSPHQPDRWTHSRDAAPGRPGRGAAAGGPSPVPLYVAVPVGGVLAAVQRLPGRLRAVLVGLRPGRGRRRGRRAAGRARSGVPWPASRGPRHGDQQPGARRRAARPATASTGHAGDDVDGRRSAAGAPRRRRSRRRRPAPPVSARTAGPGQRRRRPTAMSSPTSDPAGAAHGEQRDRRRPAAPARRPGTSGAASPPVSTVG